MNDSCRYVQECGRTRVSCGRNVPLWTNDNSRNHLNICESVYLKTSCQHHCLESGMLLNILTLGWNCYLGCLRGKACLVVGSEQVTTRHVTQYCSPSLRAVRGDSAACVGLCAKGDVSSRRKNRAFKS